MDHLIWRVVLSPDVPDGLGDIRSSWTFVDLFEAHLALDLAEAVEKDRPKPKEQ